MTSEEFDAAAESVRDHLDRARGVVRRMAIEIAPGNRLPAPGGHVSVTETLYNSSADQVIIRFVTMSGDRGELVRCPTDEVPILTQTNPTE